MPEQCPSKECDSSLSIHGHPVFIAVFHKGKKGDKRKINNMS
jgi:hypothetical protein